MRSRKMISIMIILLILVSSGIVFAADDEIESAKSYGEQVGYNNGYVKGLENWSKGENASTVIPIPDRTKIENDNYSFLAGKKRAIKDAFYIGYTNGFILGYQESMGTLKPDGTPVEIKTDYADVLGSSLGEIYGFRDFYSKLKSNWIKAIPTNNKIIEMFDLSKQTSVYRATFLSEFRVKFQEGYEEGYEKANLEPMKLTLEWGTKDGETIGSVLGNIYGAKDYHENRTINHLRNMPSDFSITSDYSLNKDSKEYKDGFLAAFKAAYEESYKETYRDANIMSKLRDEEKAYENGRDAGINKGEQIGTKDFMERKSKNWMRNQITSSVIIKEYNLVYQTPKYRQGFISGFWEGFLEGYQETYDSLSQGELGNKVVVDTIPIAGGSLSSPDNRLLVSIDKGTYYNDVSLSIESLSDNNYKANDKRFTKASKLYKVDIGNYSKDLDNSKKVQLSFEYHYDNYKGGIYKLVNNNWVYIASTIVDGYIIAEVNPNTLVNRDNIYCVLIDKESVILTDTMAHWAKDEIETYVRRNIIYGYTDGTFKPEREITRAEFLTLLSRQYNWKLPTNPSNIEVFRDYGSFGTRDKIISYGIKEGYIQGYEDNTFRPNDPITYKEIEILMSRVLNDKNFKWYNTSARMLYEKKIKSNSYNSMNNRITRAEVTYMLYILNQWRY